MGRRRGALKDAIDDGVTNDHTLNRRLERFSARYGVMPAHGPGSQRFATDAEVRAFRLHTALTPSGGDYSERAVALVERVVFTALDHPEVRFIVAHPDWLELADTAEEVVAIHNRRGGVCTVVDTFKLLEEAS